MIGMSCPAFCNSSFEKIWEAVSKEFRHWEILSEVEHALQKSVPLLMTFPDKDRMTYSVHSAMGDTNVAALCETMRRATLAEFRSEMEQAARIGAHTVTIHPGVLSMAVNDSKQRSMHAAKLSMKEIDKMQREYGTIATIENMPSFKYMLGQTAAELAEIVEGTDLKICFDIGHANTTNQTDEMMSILGDRIYNIHIHDNMGDHDAHMTIGEGNIDFKRVLHGLRKYSRNYIIEAKSLESAIVSRDRLKRLLG